MFSFGEKLLKKYGWDEGKGIGKDNQGIVNPIKATYKFDQTGVGYDIGEQFTVHWWEHMYNKSAEGINKPQNDEKAEEIKPKAKTFDNKSFYNNRFKQGKTLNSNRGNEETVESDDEPEPVIEEEPVEKKKKSFVSDEDLYKLCEGRTAHKGARHGIKMSGKLARIMEQEALELEALLKYKEKKEKSEKRKHENVVEEIVEEVVEADTEVTKKKKKKKKNKTHDSEHE